MGDRAFYEALPAKRMGAGCLFFNADGDVLLVKPTYKETWEIPGGVVEENESPRACCEREVMEELGLSIPINRLLVVDYNTYPTEPHKTESLMWIFDGDTLSEGQLSAITLQPTELSEWRFFAVENLPALGPSLSRRIIQAVQQKRHGSTAYLENQDVP